MVSPPLEKVKKRRKKVYRYQVEYVSLKCIMTGFPGGSVIKNSPDNAGNTGSGSIPNLGRSYMPRSN